MTKQCQVAHVQVGVVQGIKHFFAIFRKYSEVWSWNALSNLYKNSPFLNLDDSGEEESIISNHNEDMSISNEEEEKPFVENEDGMNDDGTGDLYEDDNKVGCQTASLKYMAPWLVIC